MFRYIAFIWNPANPAQCETTQLAIQCLEACGSHWQGILDGNGCKIFCTCSQNDAFTPLLLTRGHGVILGSIFKRNHDPEDQSAARKAVFGESQTRDIIETRGRALISDYWGDYVAILREPSSSHTFVIKDPTGHLPCLGTAVQDVLILCSCVSDILKLGLARLSINWRYVTNRLRGSAISGTENGLNEIFEVSRGECLEVDPQSSGKMPSRHLYWSPLTFCNSDDIMLEDRNQAMRAIRSTIVSCTHTWASCHDSLLLRLSGGLDSSILLGCLKDAPTQPRITAYTYHEPSGRADARRWARMSAHDADCEHLECVFDPAAIRLEDLLHQQSFPQPFPAIADFQTGPVERRYATERGATAVFTGDGGDAGLGSVSIDACLEQYLRLHGLLPGAFRVALLVSLCQDISIWRVLTKATRRWLFGPSAKEMQQLKSGVCKLINPSVLGEADPKQSYLHPWFPAPDALPPGIHQQLGDLTGFTPFYDAFAEPHAPVPYRVMPMYSQPAVELFLRIPTYVQIDGGRDRGLARRAFSGRVPPQLLARLWKDRAPEFLRKLFQHNLGFLREFLLDGMLVKEGLLDRVALERALSHGVTNFQFPEGELLHHFDLEVWLQHWAGHTKYGGNGPNVGSRLQSRLAASH